MTLLTPLGLLGLLGIAVLILIYIIKPNYQQKMVSSTFVWKLSLKYKKKRLPTSKLRNILLIICQVLILTSCAAILAQPAQVLKEKEKDVEVIAVIDSSASMRTIDFDDKTRFERAVEEVLNLSEKMRRENGTMSVIIADNTPSFLAQRATSTALLDVDADLNMLLEGETACSYGASDVNSAMVLCETIIDENPDALIYVYTDTNYEKIPNNEKIKLVSISSQEEWNAGILDAAAEIEDNYYTFYVDVACYGKDEEIEVTVEVQDANAMDSDDVGNTYVFTTSVLCSRDNPTKVIFITESLYSQNGGEDTENMVYYRIPDDERIFSYQSVHISIVADDAFPMDNSFNLYDGQRQVIKVQYASGDPEKQEGANSFFPGALYSLQANYDRWELQITEVKNGEEPALEGFDFYIFEHKMPESMPKDGVVFLVDPDSAPIGSDFRVAPTASSVAQDTELSDEGIIHPILNNVVAGDITVSKYKAISYFDPAYEVLMTCVGSPVLLARKDGEKQTIILSFSLHYSSLPIVKDFPILMNNIFEYFIPTTVTGNSFEVYEKVEVNARGPELYVELNDEEVAVFKQENTTENTIPGILSVNIPGTYDLTQTTYFGNNISESIYVKIPASESNIWAKAESLTSPYKEQDITEYYKDLVFYVACALTALLFAEWLLQCRENM